MVLNTSTFIRLFMHLNVKLKIELFRMRSSCFGVCVFFKVNQLNCNVLLSPEVEPFLILANRDNLMKISSDCSSSTVLKQVKTMRHNNTSYVILYNILHTLLLTCWNVFQSETNTTAVVWQDLKRAVTLDFDYQQQMIYWIEVTNLAPPHHNMISRMHINGSDVQVSVTVTTMRMNDGYL